MVHWDFRFKVSNKTTALIIVFICLAVIPAPGHAVGERPVISGAKVYVYDGNIVSDLLCGGLFSEEIVGTVQSGLPAVVELLYSLTTRENKTVKRGIHSYELRYDVWEDVYAVKHPDSTTAYDTFEQMGRAIEALRRVSIIPLQSINLSSEYSIQFSIAVHPLRGIEKKEIEGWVGETVGGRTEGSWHEQVLNLNELIHRFFSRGKETSKRSEWYRTGLFSPGRLPGIKTEINQRGGTVTPAWAALVVDNKKDF